MSVIDPQLTRTAIDAAPLLLGTILTVQRDGHQVAVRITEVEAYEGSEDPGSHAYRGRTKRNDALFGPAGTLYCYFTYGMHHCVNIVCGNEGRASAVLLRGGEVILGEDTARVRRRNPRRVRDLANGPAKLAQALGLDLRCNGLELITGAGATSAGTPDDVTAELGATLTPLPEIAPPGIRSGPRVGVAGPGGSGDYPWRFWLEGESTVSTYRAAKAGNRGKPAGSQPREG